MALDILIVDDERDIRELVAGVLSDEGYDCRTAGDSQSALAAVDARRPSLVLLDVWLHGSPMDGLEVLDAIKAREPELPVIIFSGHGNIDTAVAAISRGAVDFIEKPFEAEKLLHLVGRATETERLRRENQQLKQVFSGVEEFTGSSGAINQVRATLKRVANTGSRLLITGPAGSGKEVGPPACSMPGAHAPTRPSSASIPPASPPNGSSRNCSAKKPDGTLIRSGLLESADVARSISTKWPTCRCPRRRASARADRPGFRPRGGNPPDPRGRARRVLHFARSGKGNRRTPLPRGSVLSPQRGADHHPGSA